VQVGTANFVDPGVYERILAGLAAYVQRHGLGRLSDVVGTLQMPGAVAPDAPPETGG
jgi:dihydroorotate dehydrogenase